MIIFVSTKGNKNNLKKHTIMKTINNYKITMFATANDTDVYVLAVDGYFGYVTRQQAIRGYDMIGDIENSPFGSAQILPPRYQPIDHWGKDMSEGRKVSDYAPIDIIEYIQKKIIRSHNQPYVHRNCLDDYLLRKKFAKWFL